MRLCTVNWWIYCLCTVTEVRTLSVVAAKRSIIYLNKMVSVLLHSGSRLFLGKTVGLWISLETNV